MRTVVVRVHPPQPFFRLYFEVPGSLVSGTRAHDGGQGIACLKSPTFPYVKMDSAMAIIAKGDQILGYIFTQRTSPADVMNLEKLWVSAALTSPAIALEHLCAKVSVGMWI
jgi:hypothetical protein